MRANLRSLIMLLIPIFCGCSAGEFTLEVMNRTERPLEVVVGEKTLAVGKNSRNKIYVSKSEGTSVTISSEGKELETFEMGGSLDIPVSGQGYLFYLGNKDRLYLTDPSEFFAFDSTVDKALAAKDPKVKIASKMWEKSMHPIKTQATFSEGDTALSGVPAGTHYYRLVRVPDEVGDDKLGAYLKDEFKSSVAKTLQKAGVK